MTSPRTQLNVYERRGEAPRGFRAAVSLHCHTHHSKELLTFIPHYAAQLPVVSRLFRSEMDRYLTIHGKTIDFARAWWTPPASPRQVLEVETLRIEREFGLPALVSITDHDDIDAGMLLRLHRRQRRMRLLPLVAPLEARRPGVGASGAVGDAHAGQPRNAAGAADGAGQ